jgi:hypothetical protein
MVLLLFILAGPLMCAAVVEARGCGGAADTMPAWACTDPSVIMPVAASIV